MADPAINFDTAFSIAEIVTIVGGGATLIWRMSKMATRFEMLGTVQAREITALKDETHELRVDIEKLNDIMVELTRFQGRMDRVDDRMMMQGKRLDESIARFNEWTQRVYEERHRQIVGRISKIENGNG